MNVIIIEQSLASLGSKLLSMIKLFRLRDAVDKVLTEEQYGFRKDRGCDKIAKGRNK